MFVAMPNPDLKVGVIDGNLTLNQLDREMAFPDISNPFRAVFYLFTLYHFPFSLVSYLSSSVLTVNSINPVMERISQLTILVSLFIVLLPLPARAQIQISDFPYSVTPEQPYGSYNPEAPVELKDFEPMIGSSLCESVQRNPDGSWQDTTDVIWEFRYIFDGKAVQDITWKGDGNHSSSIRQFNADSSKWAVTYFSANNANFNPPGWYGGKTDNGNIVLTRPQQAPGSGTPGTNRLTFFRYQ